MTMLSIMIPELVESPRINGIVDNQKDQLESIESRNQLFALEFSGDSSISKQRQAAFIYCNAFEPLKILHSGRIRTHSVTLFINARGRAESDKNSYMDSIGFELCIHQHSFKRISMSLVIIMRKF